MKKMFSVFTALLLIVCLTFGMVASAATYYYVEVSLSGPTSVEDGDTYTPGPSATVTGTSAQCAASETVKNALASAYGDMASNVETTFKNCDLSGIVAFCRSSYAGDMEAIEALYGAAVTAPSGVTPDTRLSDLVSGQSYVYTFSYDEGRSDGVLAGNSIVYTVSFTVKLGSTDPIEPIDPQEPIIIPVVTDDDNIPPVNIEVKLDGNVAKASVDSESIAAIVEAVSSSEQSEPVSIVIDVSPLGGDVSGIGMDTETWAQISEALNDPESNIDTLTVKLPTATVELDAPAVEAVTEQATGDDLRLVVDKGSIAEQGLTEAQIEVISEMSEPVVLDAYFVSNNVRIHDFKGGSAQLTVAYPTTHPIRVWYVSEAGSKEYIPSSFDGSFAEFVVYHFSNYVIETDISKGFVDVEYGDYFYDPVYWALGLEITTGVDETHFAPFDVVTRAQMVTFIWRAAGCPEPESDETDFVDIVPGEFYYDAVLWGTQNGVIRGTSLTTFSPHQTVTRGQAVTFLARHAGVMDEDAGFTHGFTDVPVTAYYYNAIAWAAEAGIAKGMTATTYEPDAYCLRGQAITFLYRYYSAELQ